MTKFRQYSVYQGYLFCSPKQAILLAIFFLRCRYNYYEFISQEILHIAEKSWHPIEKEKHKCSIMILDNLMEPQWILVDCNKPFMGDVLCSIKDVSSYLLKKSTLNHFCPKYSVLLDNKCYKFYWFDMDKTFEKALCGR